jgi:GT2 family glycosyltransferase
MKIIALATCHNRKFYTLRALNSIFSQNLPDDYHLTVCLVDGGSSDGTVVEVREKFPQVNLIMGTDSLFWASGMYYGWIHFVKDRAFDFLFVFNDDILLFEDSLKSLVNLGKEILSSGERNFAITGALKEPNSESVSYGGVVRSCFWHPLRFHKIPPNNKLQLCDTLNMNCVLISYKAVNKIGLLKDYVHGRADYDFGLRLKGLGGKIFLTPGFVGECKLNPNENSSLSPDLTLKSRWQKFVSIKEQNPKERATYYRRHCGKLWFFFWLLPYYRFWLRFFWLEFKFFLFRVLTKGKTKK